MVPALQFCSNFPVIPGMPRIMYQQRDRISSETVEPQTNSDDSPGDVNSHGSCNVGSSTRNDDLIDMELLPAADKDGQALVTTDTMEESLMIDAAGCEDRNGHTEESSACDLTVPMMAPKSQNVCDLVVQCWWLKMFKIVITCSQEANVEFSNQKHT
ncbi:hypothetical protein V6N12_030790 [Hibiscus sabdariffa]|uniref:Uncharacterized protein n=1 Tax=Hibiscus sabdariffa TaxID=183260 RepID=A0ABR2E6Z6_9ROSI